MIAETHESSIGKHMMDSFTVTERVMTKLYMQQHVPDGEFHRSSPHMHRIVAATFCGTAPVCPSARHVDEVKRPKYGANNKGGFVRHKDGNTANNEATNIEWVTLEEAMANYDDWVVDFDILLDDEEKRLVADPEWRRGLTFGLVNDE